MQEKLKKKYRHRSGPVEETSHELPYICVRAGWWHSVSVAIIYSGPQCWSGVLHTACECTAMQ